MTMVAPEIPDHFRAEAVVLGLPDALVGLKWAEHCAWVDLNIPGRNYGGAAWSRFVRSVVADLSERKTKEEIRDDRARREAAEEASRKRAADLLYRDQAISLPQWLAMLRTMQEGGYTLKPHEARLLEYPMLAGDDPGVWLLDALAPINRDESGDYRR